MASPTKAELLAETRKSMRRIALLERAKKKSAIESQELKRLRAELEAAELRQAATDEILGVISSSPADTRPVFDAILDGATRLCDAHLGVLNLFDGECFRTVAQRGGNPEFATWVIERGRFKLYPAGMFRLIEERQPFLANDTKAGALYRAGDPQAVGFVDLGGARSYLSVPMVKDRRTIGAIAVYRPEVRPFTDKQIELVETFANQAVIAIENVRLFNEAKEALEQQTATAEILRVIAGSPNDVQPVFDAIVKGCLPLFGGMNVALFLRRGHLIDRVAFALSPGYEDEARDMFPTPLDGGGINARAIQTGRLVQVADVIEEPWVSERTREVARRMGFRSLMSAPLLRDGTAIGAIAVFRAAPAAFSAQQVELLKTFADQAVIAIENVRLFNETKATLERQTATADILKVIAGSPTDVQPVFDVIAQSAMRLLGGQSSAVTRVVGDVVHLAAITGTSKKGNEALRAIFPRPVSHAHSLHARVARTGKPAFRADYESEPGLPPAGLEMARARGFRSDLVVPLLLKGVPIGGLSVARREPGEFAVQQIQLLEAFASQAVIAIENVRLFNETQEALERQTATAEILKVIAESPTDTQPVFDAIAENAMRLFAGQSSVVTRIADGMLHLAAMTAGSPEGAEAIRNSLPVPVSEGGFHSQVAHTGLPVFHHDIESVADVLPGLAKIMRARGVRSALAVPMLREGATIGTIAIARREPGHFSDHQIGLLQTFADQAVIAIENVRLFNETKEALERQTATAEILKVIASSPADVQPVFEAIARSANRLCGGLFANVFWFDGELLHHAASEGISSEANEVQKARYSQLPSRSTVSGRVILSGKTVRLENSIADPDYDQALAVAAGGSRRLLGVPMLRTDTALGAIVVGWASPGSISPIHEQLLTTFADQAAIAIENVRLFNETKEALERQTATAQILKVIASSPADVQPVFDAIANSSNLLIGGFSTAVVRVMGEALHLAAYTSTGEAGDAALRAVFPLPIASHPSLRRVVHEKATLQTNDVEAELSSETRELARQRGWRSRILVPLVREDAVVGIISVTRREPGSFDAHHVALLETFADQAVIAIENARLFNETKDALERQTATAEILKVIASSPSDVQPVFNSIAMSAMRLFAGQSGTVTRIEGGNLHLAASTSTSEEGNRQLRSVFPRPVSEASLPGRVALTGVPAFHTDTETQPGLADEPRATARARGYRSMLVVPMMRDGRPIGTVGITRKEPGPFSANQIATLSSFADQAVIAIENVRLFKELESRTAALSQSVGQLTALGEVGQAISSTLDLDTVLQTIVSRALQLTGLDGGSMYEYDERAEVFHMQVSENMAEELLQVAINEPIRLGSGAVGRAGVTREPIQVPDTLDDSYQSDRKELLIRSGYRAVLAVPLLREDNLLGALLVTRKTPGMFPDETVALLQTFATQSAMAIQNARLFREIAEKGRQLEIASHHKSDFLASMSHELRTPLNAILGFNELILAEIYGEVPEGMKEPLTDIQTSGKHLLRLINNVLDLAKIEAGRMELALADYSVHDTVESVRSTLRPLAAEKGLEFLASVPEDIPIAYGDSGRITQCLMNLAGNSLKFTKAGKVEIVVGLNGDILSYRVNDTGIGISPDKIGSLFTEFKQTDATIASEYGGTGLGLSISKKFIEMHGGRVWVESELGKGSSFIFEVPLRAQISAGAGS